MGGDFRATTFTPIAFSGSGSLSQLNGLGRKIHPRYDQRVFFLDSFLKDESPTSELVRSQINPGDLTLFIDSSMEPTTDYVDDLVKEMKSKGAGENSTLLIAVGGGTTMDCAKASSVVFTNRAYAKELQGWDLVKLPGLPKIGIPTLGGTGAEASRTAVLTDLYTGLKLGINSDFSRFDGVILDPDLSASVPKEIFFFTGLDAYMHAFEILRGRYRNEFSDHLARLSISLVEDVFESPNPLSLEKRGSLMFASYFSGLALSSSFVGLVHPVSAAIGFLHSLPHGLANVVSLMALSNYYPIERDNVQAWAKSMSLEIPSLFQLTGTAPDVDAILELLAKHSRPLSNHFGENWKKGIDGKAFRAALGGL